MASLKKNCEEECSAKTVQANVNYLNRLKESSQILKIKLYYNVELNFLFKN